jgi:hypothetical protein
VTQIHNYDRVNNRLIWSSAEKLDPIGQYVKPFSHPDSFEYARIPDRDPLAEVAFMSRTRLALVNGGTKMDEGLAVPII